LDSYDVERANFSLTTVKGVCWILTSVVLHVSFKNLCTSWQSSSGRFSNIVTSGAISLRIRLKPFNPVFCPRYLLLITGFSLLNLTGDRIFLGLEIFFTGVMDVGLDFIVLASREERLVIRPPRLGVLCAI